MAPEDDPHWRSGLGDPARHSVAGGRVAKIFLAETEGVVLRDITAEGVRDDIAQIDDQTIYHQPHSLDAATTILADALTD